MSFLISLLAFILVLGIIIFVHEAGHLIAARMFNVRVLAFSLGFGKRLWGFTRGETDYRVSAIPLGGYVKLAGEEPDEVSDDPRDFQNRPRWQRVIVYIAGPAMNVVLSVVVMALAFTVGVEVANPRLPAVIGGVAPDGPAAEAGLAAGDRIVSIDGSKVTNWQAVMRDVITAPERTLEVTYERGEEQRTTTVTPIKIEGTTYGSAGMVGESTVRVQEVAADTPAERAGVQEDDVLVSVAGERVSTRNEVVALVSVRPGEELPLTVQRGEQELELSITPDGESGAATIGVRFYPSYAKYPPLTAVVESVHYNIYIVRETFVILGRIFTGRVAAKSALSGPIEIAALSGEAARRGVSDLIHLLAFISISIAIVNLLPVPILDGGQIVILLVESVIRRDLSLALKERLAQVGFVLIVALMLTVIFFDLQKQIPWLGGG